ncbi:MAG: hypothetical protein HQL76_14635 [Magnetococcales bacterium]|nr:hypothetical protein [Magnetococcales bacterium]
MGFPPPVQHELKIFDTLPAANETTFFAGIPSTNTSNEALAIILYSPNLQIVASLDNSHSDVTSTYQTSISQGFTFSTSQSISITSSVGVSIEIVTASVSTTFALSFTEQWSTTTTKTMSFSCPPGKKAFVYQGTLMSQVLKFNSGTNTYSWSGGAAKALTQVLVTSATPIGIAPSNTVTINS